MAINLTLAMTLTLNFQGQIFDLLFLSQIPWSDCHETKKNTLIEHKACNVAINFDLDHDLDLEFSRSNIQFVRFLHNMVLLPRNEIQTYWLNTRPQMWPSTLTLAMTLALIFQGQIFNLLYLCKNTRPHVWPSILTFAMTLNFSRSFL